MEHDEYVLSQFHVAYSNETFTSGVVNCDFAGANFEGVVFVDCTFVGWVFSKGNVGSLALFACEFTNCTFATFDFRRIVVGAHGGFS